MTLRGVTTVILRHFTESGNFGRQCVKPVKVRPMVTVCDKNVVKEPSLWQCITLVMFKEITENECVNERHPFVKGDNLIPITG